MIQYRFLNALKSENKVKVYEYTPVCDTSFNLSRPNVGQREKTYLNLIFIFTLLCGTSKGFMKGLHKTF